MRAVPLMDPTKEILRDYLHDQGLNRPEHFDRPLFQNKQGGRLSRSGVRYILQKYVNPVRKMQGGFITAAFDNTFGPLSYLAARCPCTTLDLHTQFVRPVSAGDRLTVTAKVVSRSARTMYLSATAFDANEKLVATCSANMVLAKPQV